MRIIFLDNANRVYSVGIIGDNQEIPIGAIVSDTGEIGQIMQTDGTFITPEPEPVEPVPYMPTNAEIAQMISDLQADLLIAGVI